MIVQVVLDQWLPDGLKLPTMKGRNRFESTFAQYSTETEPSRQPSFNYASRQPSFKQNSSETEPHPLSGGGGGGAVAPGDHFFPGGLPPPSPDHLLHRDEEDVQGQCCQM